MVNVPKKIPERRCVGCGEHFPKSALIRIVRAPDGSISLDFTGKKSGRGAYLCRNVRCFAKARKAKRAEQSLDCSISESVYNQLEEQIKQGEE